MPARLAERLQPYDAVMMVRERTKFPREVFERLPNLKLLVTAAMWNVAIDLDGPSDLVDARAWRRLERRAIRNVQIVATRVDTGTGVVDGNLELGATTANGALAIRER